VLLRPGEEVGALDEALILPGIAIKREKAGKIKEALHKRLYGIHEVSEGGELLPGKRCTFQDVVP